MVGRRKARSKYGFDTRILWVWYKCDIGRLWKGYRAKPIYDKASVEEEEKNAETSSA